MIPFQHKSSRRSSILKSSKSLPSLQHGEDSNNPSAENSPTVVTTKIRRRVSFAEKKHVKEFCDSIEQGTVWDNTYEESDLSQMKTNQSDKFVEISQVTSINYCQSQTLSNIEIDPRSIFDNKSCQRSSIELVHHNSIDHQLLSLKQSFISCNPEILSNKENIPAVLKLSTNENSLIDNGEIFEYQRQFSNTNPSPAFSIYCDDEIEQKEEEDCVNRSNHENVSMDCTTLARDSLLISTCTEADNNINFINNMDKTQLKNCKDSATLHVGAEEKTQVFNDNQMEFTECIPNFRNYKLSENIVDSNLCFKSIQCNSQENRILYNQSNAREPLSSLNIYNQLEQFDKEKTQFFYNKSMEMTEVVPHQKLMGPIMTNEDKTQFFHSESMEITEAVPDLMPLKPHLNKEETQVFYNKSMEITEVVPDLMPLKPHLNEEKTQVFYNKSMEITEVVPNLKLTEPSIVSEEKTQFFHNKSMEMTEVVPNLKLGSTVMNEDKTQVFHNKSMDITEPIANVKFPIMLKHSDNEKTQVFHNKSMEMTEVISNMKVPIDINFTRDDKTQFFHNKSMDITYMVPNKNFSAIPSLSADNKTRVFHNKSMDITEPIVNVKFPIMLKHSDNEKTQVFHNKSMEMTEVIDSSKLIPGQIHLNESDNNPLCDKSVESTRVILPFNPSKNSENTHYSTDLTLPGEIDHNYFMELTEAIPSLKRPYSLMATENKPSSVSSSPNIKNSRNSLIYDEIQNIYPKDSEKLHQLHQNSNKTDSPLLTDVLPSDNSTQVGNIVSTNLSNVDNSNTMEMTDVISFSQERQKYIDEVQKNNFIPIMTVNNLDTPEKMQHTLHDFTLIDDKPPVKGSNNLYTSTQTDLSKENLSQFYIPAQSDDCAALERTESLELIQENSNHNHMLKSPNSLQTLNQIIDENSILPDNENNYIEEMRFSRKNKVSIENRDIPYGLTEPILQNKKIVQDNCLELEETPSFIYNQSSENHQTSNKAEIQNFSDPQLPSNSFTMEIDQMNLNKNYENEFVDKLSEAKTTNVCKPIDCLTQSVEEHSTTDKDKNEPQTFDIIFDDCQYNQDKGEKSINETNKFVIKQNNNDSTDIIELSVPSMIKYNENELLDQCHHNKNNCSNFVEERNVNTINEKLLTEEEFVTEDKIIEENFGYEKIKKDHMKKSSKHTDKYGLKSVYSEYDSIIEKIMKTEKNYKHLRNELKYKYNLCLTKIEKQQKVKDENESTIVENVYKSPYEVLEEGLQSYAENKDCIWKIYDINSKRVCVEFYKTALFLLIKLHVPDDENELEHIETVNVISRLKDEEPAILKITDSLIIQRIDTKIIKEKYKTYEDIPNLIAHVTDEIKVIYDFYDDLEKLSNIYIMDISEDRISFNIRTKHLSIILKISINIKSFPNIRADDVDVVCLLGSVDKNSIRLLVECIKCNSKFLSTYIKKAEDLINLFEESNLLVKKK